MGRSTKWNQNILTEDYYLASKCCSEQKVGRQYGVWLFCVTVINYNKVYFAIIELFISNAFLIICTIHKLYNDYTHFKDMKTMASRD